MIKSDEKIQSVEDCGTNSLSSEEKSLGFGRDPSFSGWCAVDEITHPTRLQNKNVTDEVLDFDLPLIQKNMLENGILHGKSSLSSNIEWKMEPGSDNDDKSSDRLVNKSESYLPFDIDNSHGIGRIYEPRTNENNPMDGMCELNTENPICVVEVLRTVFFILVWYTFSTILTLYNKTLLGDHMGKFPAPLLMNAVHFVMQAVSSNAITWFWSDRFDSSVISWRDYIVRVVPTALSMALDVNLSNESLVFISVTFATMCKSASPIFLLLFAFAFRLESPSVKLLGIIFIISVGVLLTVAKETEFEFWGFIFVMLAAVMSGFRWTMTQILLQREVYGLKNPLKLMSFVTPIMAIATALLSLMLDPWHEFRMTSYFDSPWHTVRSCFLLLFGGTLAFFMVLTEFILVSVTSAVTVTIAGVVKEAVTILVAVFYFHDQFTWLKGLGLATIMVGVSLFNWYKYQKLQRGETNVSSPTETAPPKYVILDEPDQEYTP